MKDPLKTATLGLTSFVTFKLSRTQNKLNAQANHFLKAHSDLTLVEWRILQLMRLFEGASMSQLATEVQMDKGQLSRKVAAMTKQGLITTNVCDNDHRKQDIALTDKANAMIENMMPIMKKRQQMLVDGISKEDLDTFFRVLSVIDEAAEFRDIS